MRRFIIPLILFLLLLHGVALAQDDLMGRLAEESEIKAIATVKSVRSLTPYSDGTLKQVTFQRVYALTPYISKQFTGSCRTIESRWQVRAKDTIYFDPKPGQKVLVTVSSDQGAITSYTLLTKELERVAREEPNRLHYNHGKALIRPVE